MKAIRKGAHLVPVFDDANIYYINKYVNWDQFHTSQDIMFQSSDLAVACTLTKSLKTVEPQSDSDWHPRTDYLGIC